MRPDGPSDFIDGEAEVSQDDENGDDDEGDDDGADSDVASVLSGAFVCERVLLPD
jgi:hypothetical protein